jgi:hypothetical protein
VTLQSLLWTGLDHSKPDIRLNKSEFMFLANTEIPLVPTQTPMKYYKYRGLYPQGLSGRDSKVPPYVFMAWCLIKRRDNKFAYKSGNDCGLVLTPAGVRSG